MNSSSPAPRVTRVRLERRNDGAFADSPSPRLSWMVETSASGWRQARAEVRLDATQTVAIQSDESVFLDWPFAPIAPYARHRVEVRVTGADGITGDWSDPVEVRAVFVPEKDWRADFIALAEPPTAAAPALLRAEFDIDRAVASATLFSTARGVYQAVVNGQDVDDAVLKPGWTVYQSRLLHDAVDVTALVRSGRNALGIRLAGGWWTEEWGFAGAGQRFYGEQPDALAQLRVEYVDGTVLTIATDERWRAANGPVVSSSLYHGERIDRRIDRTGWAEPGYDDSTWAPVAVSPRDIVPEAMIAEPVRRTQEVAVEQVITTPTGATILDFGQNLVGWLRVRATGEGGDVITVRHAEVLEHGELGTRPLRYARATDEFVLSGGEDVFEPEFTFHGFRYAQIDGWPGELDIRDVTAIVVGSDMRRTGWFESSHDLVNRLHENVVWGMRGNFLSVPTDCPQRDERLGWTGDIQVFAPTASFLFDSDAFLSSWLRDVAIEQTARDGVCPIIVPQVLEWGDFPAAAWGDAAAIVPGVLFERFADRRALAEHYPHMRAWADVLVGLAGDRMLWEGGFQFGDWLDPDAPPEQAEAAKTDPDIVASAYFFAATRAVARAADELGIADDAHHYATLAEEARQAWIREYTTKGGRIVSDAPTAYALAVGFDLVTGEARQRMGDRLAKLVRRGGYRISTGFVGTPLIQDALTTTGHADVARRLLLQTRVPSWLYAVTMGATTIWERWDSMLPDGSINPGEMTSFNHYAFGAIADWLHRSLAGLACEAPGWRRQRIAPVPLHGFSHASARHETPYGIASSGWEEKDGAIVVRAVVPPNTTAVVALPGAELFEVGSGTHTWTIADPRPVLELPSLSVDSSLGAFVDDEHARQVVVEAIASVDATAATAFDAMAKWEDGTRLTAGAPMVSSDAIAAVSRALAELNTARARA
ncbi:MULTISPECIES: alpha-L-rhamnosidase [Microbacterium]|uniref:alpha-L-rhamnosidase n=1 Tax=Microbacterium TaxID=33882 RepID=UPI0004009548|nr:alpha-L-rhamnosidase [Microbacterium gubbeenense]